MRTINKNQLKAMLSLTDKKNPPALRTMALVGGYLCATDGYAGAMIKLMDGVDATIVLDREQVEKYIKALSAKDVTDYEDLVKLEMELPPVYPDLRRVVPTGEYHHDQVPINPELLIKVVKAMGEEPVDITFRKGLQAAILKNNSGDIGIAMGLKDSFKRED